VTTNDYVPVDCATHSELERLALRRVAVTVDYRADGDAGERIDGVVVDLETRDGAEHLLLDTRDGPRRLRLDRLRGIFTGGRCIMSRQ
jgi:transcriptional antiterminator Rof (Rho-off)